MHKKTEHRKIKVVHIMADGNIRDSVDGYPVPVNDITKPAYNILSTMALRATRKRNKPAGKTDNKTNSSAL
jgi:uncharacterized membrane protein (UPF0127 family)